MKRILISILILVVSELPASAEEIVGSDQFKSRSHKTLTIEIVPPNLVKEYANPIGIQPLPSNKNANYGTPEKTIQTFFSSILAMDWAWNRGFWSKQESHRSDSSWRFNTERNRSTERFSY